MSEFFFEKIPFFQQLTTEQKELLSPIIFTQSVQKGEVLFLESEEAKAVFFVNEGKIRLSKCTHEGKEIVLHIRKPGDLFAATSLFCKPNDTYPATAVALEPSVVSFIRKTDFEQVIMHSPQLTLPIFQIMSERLRLSQKTLRDVALFGQYEALAQTLLRLVQDYGKQNEHGFVIQLKLTHEELGGFFGATRESVNRMINQLKRDGILSMDHGYITIHDLPYLQQLFE
ncbi:Crp/Fnr family transcriptional regulator [Alkalihalobacillus sp. LMS39]|uniref:Crp/Fnr family transcriptional regulator n=1 Tax=Alkalihalobacillus sp. LMS39 TaxID=2924032 RepID=UPI001FB3C2BA|nr:Crp/Fnr family transcriptional regulator [Alkalihalobacillus sp. LMS39]UOE93200.1 Crp/Fnr family transcriptional regulator [Alkalihalobacillus sp. LMS39]